MLFPMMFPMNKLYKELTMCDLPPTLYSIMESIVNFDREEKIKIKDLAKYSKDVIFDFNYPISNNFNKDEFEEIFLKHYMFRRINYDTLTSFKIHLDVKLNSIMPKYNLMLEGFNSLNFLGDVETHYRKEHNSKTTNSSNTINNSSSDTTNSQTKFSDTPQDHIEDVTDGSYVNEFTDITNTGTATSNSTGSNNITDNGNITENITITRADEIDEYKKYLEVMNSIYEMIFKECDSLFYGIV